jgi:hypothetical protein
MSDSRDAEIAFLKQQILMKDEMINFLKLQILSKPATVIAVENSKPALKVDPLEYLNTNCKDAINYEEFFTKDHFLNPAKNKWIIEAENIPVLKYIDFLYYPKAVDLLIDMICLSFNKLEQNKKPIYCSDIKRGKYYIKQEGNWMQIEDAKLFQMIFKKASNSCFNFYHNTTTKIKDKTFETLYKRTRSNWKSSAGNHAELSLIFFSFEIEPFMKHFHSKFKAVCSKKSEMYFETPTHDWSEFKDQPSAKNDSDSDSD